MDQGTLTKGVGSVLLTSDNNFCLQICNSQLGSLRTEDNSPNEMVIEYSVIILGKTRNAN